MVWKAQSQKLVYRKFSQSSEVWKLFFCHKHTWRCNIYCYHIFFSFLMKILENRLYQKFCFCRAWMCTSSTNSKYFCGKWHVSCIKVISNKKNFFQFTMLWKRLHFLLIFFRRVFQNCHHMKKKIKEYASKNKM